MIKIGNVYYFMYIIVALTLIVVLTIFISKKEKKFQKYFIFGLLLSGFILHFLKLIDKEYYDDLPYSLRKVSFENICAVSTLIFPWLFFVKSNKWKDYMYCFGIFGGIGALIYPGPAINHGVFSFETIRCYYCHFILVLGAILMVKCGFHTLDYHRLWRVPFTFFEVLIIILFNEIILMATGLVKADINLLFDRSYRNTSFIFGPTPAFDAFKPFIDFFVPKAFRTVPFGELKGQEMYWPIIWMVIPAFIFINLLGLVMYLPFEKDHMKSDIEMLKLKFIKKEEDINNSI